MSTLYYTENGHLIPSLGEEITRFRRARKVLTLPNTGKPATAYLDARAYTGSTVPLRMAVNGREVEPILPSPRDHYRWYETAVDPSLLVAGTNTFDFWCDTTAMNAWSLALEAGHAEPDSYVSDDGGTTWRNHHMGYLNIVRCEYLLRVRLAEGRDPAPPPMVWDDPASPRSESLKRLVPQAATQFQWSCAFGSHRGRGVLAILLCYRCAASCSRTRGRTDRRVGGRQRRTERHARRKDLADRD